MKARQFRDAVNRWREQVGTPAPEVEFFHSWPKHEHLNSEQLSWYLYWRTLWESGHVRKTSLSYMMIHVYELLSLEYIKDPQKAVDRLIRFYAEFRNIQPRLDVTVVRWIGDLYLKLGEIDNALYWYTHHGAGDLYEKLSWYRYGNLDIPLDVLKKVAGFQKTQYYRERQPDIDGQMDDMLAQVFRTFYRLEGMHPLDKYARSVDEPTLYLFSSTPIHETIYLDGFRRYENAGAFVHFVKHALRYGENLLRRAEGKSKLKCDESVGVYFQDVEALYPAPPPKKTAKEKEREAARMPLMAREVTEEPIELDLSLVKALTEETEWLVDLMQEEEAGDLLVRPVQTAGKEPGLRSDEGVNEAKATPAGKLLESLFASDDGDLHDVLAALSDAEQDFLRHLASFDEPQDRRSLAEWLKARRLFLDATVMKINDLALDSGLDPILEEDGDAVALSEEHEACIRKWAHSC